MLDRITADVPDYAWRIERGLEGSPFEQDAFDPVVDVLSRQISVVTGRLAESGFMVAWTDAALIRSERIPVNLSGPGGAGAQAAVELADHVSVISVADIPTRTIAECSS